jgi:hypothetical protein
VLKTILKEIGMNTPDDRVYKVISVMLENKLQQIIEEVQTMQA